MLSTRGGDFDLQLGTDVSIGYLQHDAENVQLYLEETPTFLVLHRRGVGRADGPDASRACVGRATRRGGRAEPLHSE